MNTIELVEALQEAINSGKIQFVRIQDQKLLELEVTSVLHFDNNNILVGLILSGDR